jgi:Dephospho-CoA kinase
MNNDPEIISSIVSEFGKDSYLDGRLNRAYLAAAVFGSPEKVQKLNAIVHPAVVKQSDLLLKKELERNDLVFYEAALIFEAGMTERFDYILLITADVKVRVSRALARGGISEDEIRKRISSQISEEEKINRSHFVIINNGTQEELREKLNNFLQFLLKGEAEKLHQFPHFFK